MGLDDEVKVPRYTLKDGQLYVHELGSLRPLTVGAAGHLIEHHRVEANYYSRADPARAEEERALADDLSTLVAQQAEGTKAA